MSLTSYHRPNDGAISPDIGRSLREHDGYPSVDSVKADFRKVAGVSTTDPDRDSLAERIHVVAYDDATPRAFLNTRR